MDYAMTVWYSKSYITHKCNIRINWKFRNNLSWQFSLHWSRKYTYCGHFEYTCNLCQHWDEIVTSPPDDNLVVIGKVLDLSTPLLDRQFQFWMCGKFWSMHLCGWAFLQATSAFARNILHTNTVPKGFCWCKNLFFLGGGKWVCGSQSGPFK